MNAADCVRRCMYVCTLCVRGWLAGWHSLRRWSSQKACLDSVCSGVSLLLPCCNTPPPPSLAVLDAVLFKKVERCLSQIEREGRQGRGGLRWQENQSPDPTHTDALGYKKHTHACTSLVAYPLFCNMCVLIRVQQ